MALGLGLALGGCGGGASPGGAAGQGGEPGGAGEGGAATAGTGGPSGAAGDTSAGGAGGVVATSGGAGASGTVGSAGSTGSAAGAAGNPTDAAADTGGATDASTPPTDAAPRSNNVLIYCVTTGFRHGSIPAAAMAITTAAATKGLTTELVGCSDKTNMPDPTKLTAAALAGYGAVILLANSGEPFGYPATQEIQNLVDYVQQGGALVGIEDADHCYDGQFGHPATPPYVNLIGNDFVGHPGGVAPATCTTMMPTQPAAMQLPATFSTTDEIYATTMFRMDNLTVLTCVSSGDGTKTMRPVSYVRQEGMGRVFYTALGHDDARWTAPMDATHANSRLVEDHVLPALLWTMRR